MGGDMTDKQTITSWRMSITWSDGETEGLASCLPEHIYEELLIYFKELEDLREEHDAEMRDEPYNFEDNTEEEVR
jgi:hypothetical protein